jgi:hypothetical protein
MEGLHKYPMFLMECKDILLLILIILLLLLLLLGTADGGTVVKALYYKSEGRWFDSRWCHWIFPLT